MYVYKTRGTEMNMDKSQFIRRHQVIAIELAKAFKRSMKKCSETSKERISDYGKILLGVVIVTFICQF